MLPDVCYTPATPSRVSTPHIRKTLGHSRKEVLREAEKTMDFRPQAAQKYNMGQKQKVQYGANTENACGGKF